MAKKTFLEQCLGALLSGLVAGSKSKPYKATKSRRGARYHKKNVAHRK